MKVDRFFPEAARQRIAQAVREAETKSTGQIVPVVVARSSPYFELELRGALVGLGLGTAVAFFGLVGDQGVHAFLLAQAVGLAAGALLSLVPLLGRLLLAHHLGPAVQTRAVVAFHQHGLAKTAHGTGVLLFASLYERAFVVLGDQGIHDKMGDAGWQQVVAAATAELRRGDPAAGFSAAIKLVGDKLSKHFPRGGPGDGNELPDELQIDR